MKSNTATATTVTAEPMPGEAPYRGRFAPSPTGLLHLGSLVAALASFLEARRRNGTWLLRIEDLDVPRIVPGSADSILRTLESCALLWDEQPLRQSTRLPAYEAALEQLLAEERAYPCDCSRKDVPGPYPGTCRNRGPIDGPHALRFRLGSEDAVLGFHDRWQGDRSYAVADLGDPVIRRRDGLFAYQLAVVVDDASQRITDVVRGGDLLDSTPWQRALQTALGLPHPSYAHVPLITEPDGRKLAKSRRSISLEGRAPGECLLEALLLLGQSPPAGIRFAPAHEVIAWALANWRPESLETRTKVAIAEGLGFGAPLVLR